MHSQSDPVQAEAGSQPSMWKRLNNPKGARQQQPIVEEPGLEKSYTGVGDDLGLLGRRALNEGQYGANQNSYNKKPERPRREDEMDPKVLPRLPL